MEEREIELIDYLNAIWKRKGLIVGGTLVTIATALVVSLSMPKTYEVSRTLRVGRLAGGKAIDEREAIISRLKDHRVLAMAIEKFHLGLTPKEMEDMVSIDAEINPAIRYTLQVHEPKVGTQIADWMANYVINVHRPIFDKGMQITKNHEATLVATIRTMEVEIQSMKEVLKGIIEAPDVDAPAVILLQANIEDREQNLVGLRRELKESRLSRLGSENTSVIAADAVPEQPVKSTVMINLILASSLGLMGFTFLAFFLEYIENARGKR